MRIVTMTLLAGLAAAGPVLTGSAQPAPPQAGGAAADGARPASPPTMGGPMMGGPMMHRMHGAVIDPSRFALQPVRTPACSR